MTYYDVVLKVTPKMVEKDVSLADLDGISLATAFSLQVARIILKVLTALSDDGDELYIHPWTKDDTNAHVHLGVFTDD